MRGSVRKRGSTWTWYLDAPPDPVTARRRQASKGGFRTKRECQDALNETLARLREGTFVPPSQRTLGSFLLEEWLPAVRPPRVRPSTWQSYRMNADTHIIPALGHLPLQRLTPAHLTAFYRSLLDHGRRDGGGLAAKTVRNIHGELHAALRDAARWGHIARNVAASADLPKGMAPEMRVWSPAQLRAFLDHARQDRLYAAWLLFATTGMRRGEVAGLRWPDVDLEADRVSPRRLRVVVNYEVHVSEPKTAKGRRSLALDPATVAALRQHRARQAEERLAVGPRWQDSGLVFTWPDGRPVHPQRFSNWFEQLAQAAGLPRIRLHDVRHSYASAALAAGIPAKVVSERLGHASIAITMDTYSHVLPGLDAEAAGTVARLILGDGSQELARPVDKALTTDRPTPSRGKEVKHEAPGQEGVRAGGFEPPRPKTPGPKPGASAGSATLASCGELTTAGSGPLFPMWSGEGGGVAVEEQRPSLGGGHGLAVGVAGVPVAGEGAVLELDPGAGCASEVEADLDLAGLGRVRLGHAVGGDLPDQHQPGWRIPGQDPAPVAGEAVGTPFEAVATLAGLDADALQGVGGPGVLTGPPADQVGEGRERPVDRDRHGHGLADRLVRRLPLHQVASAGRSWTAQPLPSGSLKNTKEFQRPPGPSTRSGPS